MPDIYEKKIEMVKMNQTSLSYFVRSIRKFKHLQMSICPTNTLFFFLHNIEMEYCYYVGKAADISKEAFSFGTKIILLILVFYINRLRKNEVTMWK